MGVLSQIKAALDVAIRNQDKMQRTVLRTLLGELETRAKREQCTITDAMAAKRLNDTISGNDELLKFRDNSALVAENAFLRQFLPTLMSEQALQAAIDASGEDNIGGIMRYLKTHHDGKFDGKQANQLVRAKLANS
jgi:uncharacterized protein YqeY